ncbi:MAG: transposase [Chloroflexota bacterium]
MAIDYLDEPFYGKTLELRSDACRSEAKEGTTHFYRLASLYVMWRQVRLTLAVTYVLPEDSTEVVVQRLLERMQRLGLRPSVLYMDKGFCTSTVITYLYHPHIPTLIAGTMCGKKGGIRGLCHGKRAYLTDYVFPDGTTVRLALLPTRVPDKTGKRRLKWIAYVVIHLDWSPTKCFQRYRRRFCIESSYRQLGQVRARTTSCNPALRFLLLGLALLLLNCRVYLRCATTRVLERDPARWVARLFNFRALLPFFAARLNGPGLHAMTSRSMLSRPNFDLLKFFVHRLTSGFVEGLNNKIKVLKRRAFGIFNQHQV